MTLLTALPASAQNPNYDLGQVWEVNYYHIKPGQGDAFWKDFRENTKPVYESLKKEGLLSDYKVWVNPVSDHPDDWDVAVGLLFAKRRSIRSRLKAQPSPPSIMARETP